MSERSFVAGLLKLETPWTVERVTYPPEEKQIDVLLGHRKRVLFACPECQMPLPLYDHASARTWRHLDHGGYLTWLHARVPRVYCLEHGLRRVHVPWALPEARFTTAFESHAIDVLLETNILGITRLLQISLG